MAVADRPRTRVLWLRNARASGQREFPAAYGDLLRTLVGALGGEGRRGTRKAGGGWLVVGRDQAACLEVVAVLEQAGIAVDVVVGADREPA